MSPRRKPPAAAPAPANTANTASLPGEKPSSTRETFADLLGESRRGTPRDARGSVRVDRAAAESARRNAKSRAPAASRGASRASDESSEVSSGFRRPRPDLPQLAAAYGISDQQLSRLQRGEPEPEERIDLHGLRADDARRVLSKRIESAGAQGLRSVLVIHGLGKRSPTGEATLRDAVPDWLTRGALGRRVLALAPAPRRLGGEGATMVLLRKS